LLATDTVASSKPHEEAAETIVALESKREETKLWTTLIIADIDKSKREAVDVAWKQT
jgi:hypothetical protein